MATGAVKDSDWETISTGDGRADDWETIAPEQAAAPQAEGKGFFGGMAETLIPDWDSIKTIVKAGAGNPRAAMDLLGGIFGAQKEQFSKAGEAFSQGENLEGVGRVAAGALPLIGPAAAQAGERIGQGEVARGLGNMTGMLAPFGVKPGLKVAGKVTAPVRQSASDALRRSAVEQYSRVINPSVLSSSKENAIRTQRVVPELLERKVRAISRPSLLNKAEASGTIANEALEEAYAQLPQDAAVEFNPVVRRIQKAQDDLVVKGTDEVVREDLYKALEKVKQKVMKIGGEDLNPTVATTRSARQEFDDAIRSKTKLFGKTGKEAVKLEAQKEAANAIRAELAEEYPNIAKINHEVNLWLTVQDLVGETITRTASHATPLGERILTGAGMAGGLSRGIGKAALYATGLKAISRLINSTGWRTVVAVEKNRLADLLGAGKLAEAEIYAAKLAGGKGGGGGSEPLSGTIEPDIPPNISGGGGPSAATVGDYGQRQLSGAQRQLAGRVDPRTRTANQALRPSGVRGSLPQTAATTAETQVEAIGILDAITEKYKSGLPTKTNEIIFSELDSSGAGQGRGVRNWVGENVNDIPILQDVPHGAEAIERALRVRKGKVWERIVQEAEEYVRRYKEEGRLAAMDEDDIPF